MAARSVEGRSSYGASFVQRRNTPKITEVRVGYSTLPFRGKNSACIATLDVIVHSSLARRLEACAEAIGFDAHSWTPEIGSDRVEDV